MPMNDVKIACHATVIPYDILRIEISFYLPHIVLAFCR
jgi:hypothetical protein